MIRTTKAAGFLLLTLVLANLGVEAQAQSLDRTRAALPSPSSAPVEDFAPAEFLGGVPGGERSDESLSLSLAEAIQRGLDQNLGLLLQSEDVVAARGARRRALAKLLPELGAGLGQSRQTINLAAIGFSNLPDVPSVIGPFNLFDARVFLSQPILDLGALYGDHAARAGVGAAEHAYQDARDFVVLLVSNLYLQVVAGNSQVEAITSQVETADALYRLAVSRNSAGVVAGIEVLRAQVRLQSDRQRLIVASNELAKRKLVLARIVGLPIGQPYEVAAALPYAPLPDLSPERALEHAYLHRSDYQRALARVKEATAARKSANGERLPSLHLNADYGVLGNDPASAEETYFVGASLRIPIYQGGRVKGLVLEATAELDRRQAELEDLGAGIYYQVQGALLDLNATDEEVKVTRTAVELAEAQLTHAEDRFAAGVASNIEVVQAQEALANANDRMIASLFSHNLARATLTRVLGVAEDPLIDFLRGDPS